MGRLVENWQWISGSVMDWWNGQELALYWQIDQGLAKDWRIGNVFTDWIRICIGLLNWSRIGV